MVANLFERRSKKSRRSWRWPPFRIPTSLENVGNNNYSVSTLTATPAIGIPQTAGRGQILGGSLESSNVDMATQFTNLIVYQSAYQASSRVISTANNMDQDLMQLIH